MPTKPSRIWVDWNRNRIIRTMAIKTSAVSTPTLPEFRYAILSDITRIFRLLGREAKTVAGV